MHLANYYLYSIYYKINLEEMDEEMGRASKLGCLEPKKDNFAALYSFVYSNNFQTSSAKHMFKHKLMEGFSSLLNTFRN